MKVEIDFPKVIEKFDELLKRGLCRGVGRADGQMCVEAAITQAMGLPFDDEPACVEPVVRRFKITLNDSTHWMSPVSRAAGLRDLGIAQIGSAGVVDGKMFATLMAKKTIKYILPEIPTRSEKLKALLLACGEVSMDAPLEDFRKSAANAANAAAYAANAAYAADATAYAAAVGKNDPERFLRLSAALALETLRELKSPGCLYV